MRGKLREEKVACPAPRTLDVCLLQEADVLASPLWCSPNAHKSSAESLAGLLKLSRFSPSSIPIQLAIAQPSLAADALTASTALVHRRCAGANSE